MYEKNSLNHIQKLQQLKDSFQFDFIALALNQTIEQSFVHKWEYVIGNQSERFRRIVLKSGKGIAGHVYKTGKSILVPDVGEMFQQSDLFNYPIIISEELKSFCAIPLYKSNQVVGVLLGGYRTHQQVTPQQFDEFQRSVETIFGSYYNKEMVGY